MPSTIDQYQRLDTIAKAGKLSRRFWLVFTSLCSLWFFLILLAPVSTAYGAGSLGGQLYAFFGYVCHQIPSRSFFLMEHSLAVCSRCTGVYFGLVFGCLIYPLFRNIGETEPIPRIWLILAMIPIGIDWSLTFFGFWENTYFTRFMTGLILGTACAIFIIPALSEIAFISARRKHRKSVAT